ncbi:MAG: hypothetical protein RIE32_06510 [Phycisphaerales bacterium]
MPPQLPPKPKPRKLRRGGTDQFLVAEFDHSVQRASAVMASIRDTKDQLVQCERACDTLRYYGLAVAHASRLTPEMYDSVVEVFWSVYAQVDEQVAVVLRDYNEVRRQALFRHKSRKSQEKTAAKTVDDLLRLQDDYLPDNAATEYRRILSDWQAQLAVLRA